jgi:hypothetical protein
MRNAWSSSDIKSKPQRQRRAMTFKKYKKPSKDKEEWLTVPTSLERILHGQHVQQQKNHSFLKSELHKVAGRQPCRVLTQFDALPLVQKKYVRGVDAAEEKSALAQLE